MNRLVSSLRRIITIFLVVLAFFVSTAFDQHGNQLQAQAEPVTPEATGYQVDSDNNQARIKAERIKDNAEKSAKLLEEEGIKVTNRAAESAKDPNKNIIDSVREKLNLDEPIDPGTKQAARQLKDTVTGNGD
jgi:hypothetical protein